mgnify:CR=1 FL=1
MAAVAVLVADQLVHYRNAEQPAQARLPAAARYGTTDARLLRIITAMEEQGEDPLTAEALTVTGRAQWEEGAFRPAMSALEQATRLAPSSGRAFYLYGLVAEEYGGDTLFIDVSARAGTNIDGLLEGGIEGRPDNVIFYATSNRRHLLAREMVENERSTAISPSEAVEEKVSLSDRFGLWLGFHPCSQDEYLAMIDGYCAAHGVAVAPERLRAEAIEWQATRGGRSGRVAWQFFCDLAAREGLRVSG